MTDEDVFRPTESERAEYERRVTDQSGGYHGAVDSAGSPRNGTPAPVPPSLSSAFGRPNAVEGAFAEPRPALPPRRDEHARPPSPVLTQAFGPPDGSGDAFAPPPGTRIEPRHEDDSPWWKPDAARDPWRDPGSSAHLGAPPDLDGPPPPAPPPEEDEAGEGTAAARARRRWRLRELSVGSAVVILLAALFVGTAGGVTGYTLARKFGIAGLFEPDAKLTKATRPVSRPPGSVAGVASRVRPAVVSIDVHGDEDGTGSGVIIDGKGYILTNNHVAAPAASPNGSIRVIFEDQSSAPAKIVGRDPKSDLAVIKVDKPGLTVATLGDSSKMAVGDDVIAIGSPLRLADTVTFGIISALNRPVPLQGEGSDPNAVINAIQTDAAINPGNSGGALVDASTGAVIGINSAIATLGAAGVGGSIGVGFAIPINEARDIAQQLIRTGRARHATLGVNARSVTELNGTRDGAQVEQLTPGGAAQRAGLHEGDVIVGVANQLITGADQLITVVRSHQVGDRVTVRYVRGKSTHEASATLQSD
ncbi:MAG TPA: trypsin-like peptidase domain-containing protein [Mycobacteriales bacterium]|nr:trypsin-like peptidase domain-containing protein [Mycobacteriales bacterium]